MNHEYEDVCMHIVFGRCRVESVTPSPVTSLPIQARLEITFNRKRWFFSGKVTDHNSGIRCATIVQGHIPSQNISHLRGKSVFPVGQLNWQWQGLGDGRESNGRRMSILHLGRNGSRIWNSKAREQRRMEEAKTYPELYMVPLMTGNFDTSLKICNVGNKGGWNRRCDSGSHWIRCFPDKERTSSSSSLSLSLYDGLLSVWQRTHQPLCPRRPCSDLERDVTAYLPGR